MFFLFLLDLPYLLLKFFDFLVLFQADFTLLILHEFVFCLLVYSKSVLVNNLNGDVPLVFELLKKSVLIFGEHLFLVLENILEEPSNLVFDVVEFLLQLLVQLGAHFFVLVFFSILALQFVVESLNFVGKLLDIVETAFISFVDFFQVVDSFPQRVVFGLYHFEFGPLCLSLLNP